MNTTRYDSRYTDLLKQQRDERDNMLSNLNVSSERKTIFHYNNIRQRLTKEFGDFCKEFLTKEFYIKKHIDLDALNVYYSKFKNFKVHGNSMYVLTCSPSDKGDSDFSWMSSWSKIISLDKDEFVIHNTTNIYVNDMTTNHVQRIINRYLKIAFNQLCSLKTLISRATYTNWDAYLYTENFKEYHFRLIHVFDDNLCSVLSKEIGFCTNPYVFLDSINSTRITDEQKLVYLKDGRETTMKIGKGLRKVLKSFGHELNDEDLKKVTNILTLDTSDYEFLIVDGDDIPYYYHTNRYDWGSPVGIGTLSDSCMRGSGCQSFFDIYKDNASMLILKRKDEDKIIGRALLWIGVEDTFSGDSLDIMDRIYAEEKVVKEFKNWAQENNYLYKARQTFGDEVDFITPDGCEFSSCNLRINLVKSFHNYDEYPYMDTFTYSDDGDYLFNNCDMDYSYRFNEIDGTVYEPCEY